MTAALLLLADGRLPAGSHAHSGGIETAAARGLVHDLPSLQAFCLGRLHTVGAVAASLAAVTCRVVAEGGADVAVELARLDGEADARTPSPALRAASRQQGRALLRLAATAWPSATYALLGRAPHHAIGLGAVAAAAGIDPLGAATAAASSSVGGPASAAVKLLGLDPLAVTALQARLAPAVDGVAAASTEDPDCCAASPWLDLLAEEHAASGIPLFAS